MLEEMSYVRPWSRGARIWNLFDIIIDGIIYNDNNKSLHYFYNTFPTATSFLDGFT